VGRGRWPGWGPPPLRQTTLARFSSGWGYTSRMYHLRHISIRAGIILDWLGFAYDVEIGSAE
jgi:hypothetical protein